jgi:hypothetical protein
MVTNVSDCHCNEKVSIEANVIPKVITPRAPPSGEAAGDKTFIK